MKSINILPQKCEDYDANSFTGYEGWQGDPQYKHWWRDLEYFIQGGENECRCGDPGTKFCNYRTEYGIAGYRNTCPIAGKNGTYATPATLRLSDYDFTSKNIKGKIKISSVNISYSHHNRGVNVGTGEESGIWGGQFSKVQIILYKYNKSDIPSSPINSDLIEATIPIDEWGTVSTTFENEFALDTNTEDIAIDIEYFKVENTNPSIIRLRDLDINIEYTSKADEIVLEMSGSSGDRLITDNHRIRPEKDSCRTSVAQKIKCYEKGNEASAPEYKDLIQINTMKLPSGVEYVEEINDDGKTFTFRDYSGLESVAAPKEITYYTKTEKPLELKTGFFAEKPTIPKIKLQQTSFVKNELPEDGFDYLCVYNGCFEYVDMYIDNIQDESKHYKYPRLTMKDNQIKDPNDKNFGKRFYNTILGLDCGIHYLYFYVDDVKHSEFQIEITSYNMSLLETGRKTNDGDNLKQNKKQGGYADNCYIKLKRVDAFKVPNSYKEEEGGEKIYGTFKVNVHNETTNENYEIDWKRNEEKIFDIGTYYSGKRSIKFSWDPGCGEINTQTYEFYLEPQHRQYYDEFLIRSDETGFVVNSIAIQESDNYTFPIKANDIELKDKLTDVLYYGESCTTSLGKVGLGKLYIKNTKNEIVNNLYIEVNPTNNEDGSGKRNLPDEWFKKGLLHNFEENFKHYNKDIIEKVDVIGLSIKDSWADGANVYIKVNKLEPGQEMLINIPFEGILHKTIRLEFFVFGRQMPLYNTYKDFHEATEFSSELAKESSIKLSILDLIMNDLTIQRYGPNIKYPEFLDFIEEDESKFPKCGIVECADYKGAKILYGITNIDSAKTHDGKFHAIIENSPELKPVGYTIHGQDFSYNPLDTVIPLDVDITKESFESTSGSTIVKFKAVKKSGTEVQEDVWLDVYYDGNKWDSYNRGSGRICTKNNGIATFEILEGPIEDKFTAKYSGIRVVKESDPKKCSEVQFYRSAQIIETPLVNEKINILVKEREKITEHSIFTSSNGIASFKYTVPIESDRAYTAPEIMEEFVKATYNGSLEYKKSHTGANIQKDITSIEIKKIIKEPTVRKIRYTSTETVITEETTSTRSVINNNDIIKYKWTDDGYEIIDGVRWDKAIIEFDRIYIVGKLKDSNGIPIADGLINTVGNSEALSHFKNKDKYISLNDGEFISTYEMCYYGNDKKISCETTFNKLTSNTSTNCDTIYIYYNGDSKRESCYYGDDRLESIIDRTGKYKSPTNLSLINPYKTFYPGSTAELKFKLIADIDYYKNYIDLKFDLDNELQAYGIIVVYDIHKTHNDDVYNTSLTTYESPVDNNEKGLNPNSLNRDVYVNMHTSLNVLGKIQNELVQEGDINTIFSQIENGIKPNKEVEVKYHFIDDGHTGTYDLIDMVGVDIGSYSYDRAKNVLTWYINSMDSYEKINSAIRIKASTLGISDIKVHGYDYMCQPISPPTYDTKLALEINSYNADYDIVGDLFKPKWNGDKLISAYYVGTDVILKGTLKEQTNNKYLRGLPVHYKPSYTISGKKYEPPGNYYEYTSEHDDGVYSLYHYRTIMSGNLDLKAVFNKVTTSSGIFNESSTENIPVEVKLNKTVVDKEKCRTSYKSNVATGHKIVHAECRFLDGNIRKSDVINAKRKYNILKKQSEVEISEDEFISEWCFYKMQYKPLVNIDGKITITMDGTEIYSGNAKTSGDGYIKIDQDIGIITSPKTINIKIEVTENKSYETKAWNGICEVK